MRGKLLRVQHFHGTRLRITVSFLFHGFAHLVKLLHASKQQVRHGENEVGVASELLAGSTHLQLTLTATVTHDQPISIATVTHVLEIIVGAVNGLLDVGAAFVVEELRERNFDMFYFINSHSCGHSRRDPSVLLRSFDTSTSRKTTVPARRVVTSW